MKRYLIIAVALLTLTSCVDDLSWSEEESTLITVSPEVMRVLSVDNPADSIVLRSQSASLSAADLKSEQYAVLAEKMVTTVSSPEQDGVGIAGPQVGILRRVVAVQRFDKEGEPFEVYPNISIIDRRGEMECGGEGCLSVPGMYGDVMRYQDIDIKYTSLNSLCDTVETIKGFTAVIFQHECDHLDGILYTDRLVTR